MRKGDYISTILRSKSTVFSFKDIALLWGDSGNAARVRINYYIKNGDLYRIRQGFYAKDKNYNKLEAAAKIYTPSYISLETVLAKAGIVFQLYSQIFVVSYLTREIIADNQKYSYKKIKDSILTNSAGIEYKDNYSIASPERAFLDVVYLNKNYHFDNFSVINWNKVYEILPIYNNKQMKKRVEKYHSILAPVMKKEDMFAHKLVAMIERGRTANRDIFDVWFFLEKNWEINKKIVEKRTGMKFSNYLKECIKFIEKLPDQRILSGMGELLDEKQKVWAKKNLKKDTIFLLKLMLDNKT